MHDVRGSIEGDSPGNRPEHGHRRINPCECAERQRLELKRGFDIGCVRKRPAVAREHITTECGPGASGVGPNQRDARQINGIQVCTPDHAACREYAINGGHGRKQRGREGANRAQVHARSVEGHPPGAGLLPHGDHATQRDGGHRTRHARIGKACVEPIHLERCQRPAVAGNELPAERAANSRRHGVIA